jgi:hypothetical protein
MRMLLNDVGCRTPNVAGREHHSLHAQCRNKL